MGFKDLIATSAVFLFAACSASEDEPLSFLPQQGSDFEPVAVGAAVVIEGTLPDGRKLDVIDAGGDGLFEVEQVQPDAVKVRALRPGMGQVNLTGRLADGTLINNSVALEAKTVSRLDFVPCQGAYLSEREVGIPYQLLDETGGVLSGAGFYPVRSSHPDVADLRLPQESQINMFFQLGPNPGRAQITSLVDGNVHHLKTVHALSVDALTIEYEQLDETLLGRLQFWAGGQKVCAEGTTIEVEVKTPALCDARIGWESVFIRRLEPGRCEFDVLLDQRVIEPIQVEL